MSQENVEVVRRLYESGALDRHYDALRGVFDPEVVMVNPPEAVEAGTRRGADEIVTALENMQSSFDGTEHKLRELFDAGEAVVALVTFYARGRDSGAQLAQEEAHTWTFRDGRIISFEWGRDLPAALAAVGLSE
jgi:ketosteroid isomerase-like protein